MALAIRAVAIFDSSAILYFRRLSLTYQRRLYLASYGYPFNVKSTSRKALQSVEMSSISGELSGTNNLKSVRFFELVLWYDYSIVLYMFLACTMQ